MPRPVVAAVKCQCDNSKQRDGGAFMKPPVSGIHGFAGLEHGLDANP